jgi:hypothetical protein
MSSESVCQAARSWVDTGSFRTHLLFLCTRVSPEYFGYSLVVSLEIGHTASWVVSHQILKMEAQIQFMGNPFEICGIQCLFPAALVCLSIIISLILHTHSTVIWCWSAGFTSSRSTNGLSQPTTTDLRYITIGLLPYATHKLIIVNI